VSICEPLPDLQQMTRRALGRDPDQAALSFQGRWYRWGELRDLAGRIEHLIETSGAGPRAAVTFVARNQPEAVAALLSLLAQGRTIRMVYPFQSAAGIARDIERLRSAVTIAAVRDLGDEVKQALRRSGAAVIVLCDWDAAALGGFGTCTAKDALDGPEQPQIQILTSGTTGTPKQFPIAYETISRHFVAPRLSAASEADALREPPSLLFFPIGNISGIYSTVPALLRGQRAILLERFTLDAWRAYVREYRPVMGGGPPVAVQMILDADVPREEIASLRYFSTGAAPLDPTVQQAFEKKYGIPILLSYGATEFGGPVCAFTPDLHAQWGQAKFGSLGRPLPGAQIRVVDPEDGHVLSAGQEGLLEVISPRLEPRWIRTTDVGVLDDDGFLYLRGRADGAIMRGGFKLLPETIERALLTHPAVAEAAVVGVPDQRLGQVPGAVIRFKSDAEPVAIDALEAHLRNQVLATHIPVHWRIVKDIPKNRSMKTDRPAVAQLFQAA
jgi:acyl-coenzyme A synthetase/AMP-(fatty) acid ligase